eukprot:NODE_471_length_7033_cov_0.382031.p2 type:complete len:340 gc:universal NODE_471_length_7033_cov_0.382031:5677-4658(-)
MKSKLEFVAKTTSNYFHYIDRDDPDAADKLIDARTKLQKSKPHAVMIYDIALFYQSIYSHIIAWLSIGVNKAKNNKRQDLWYNMVDQAVRNCIRKETNGIPIGPKLFDVVAEYLLKCIDEKLVDAILEEFNSTEFECIRRSDNYEFYLTSTAINGDELSVVVSSVLSDYRLNINNLKVKPRNDPLAEIKSMTDLDKISTVFCDNPNSIDIDLIHIEAARKFCNASLTDRKNSIAEFNHPIMSHFVIKEYLSKDIQDMNKELAQSCYGRIPLPWRVKLSLQMLWIVKLCIERKIKFASGPTKTTSHETTIINGSFQKCMCKLKKKVDEPFKTLVGRIIIK